MPASPVRYLCHFEWYFFIIMLWELLWNMCTFFVHCEVNHIVICDVGQSMYGRDHFYFIHMQRLTWHNIFVVKCKNCTQGWGWPSLAKLFNRFTVSALRLFFFFSYKREILVHILWLQDSQRVNDILTLTSWMNMITIVPPVFCGGDY